jgi:NADH-quinone oxidoreductase subunit N
VPPAAPPTESKSAAARAATDHLVAYRAAEEPAAAPPAAAAPAATQEPEIDISPKDMKAEDALEAAEDTAAAKSATAGTAAAVGPADRARLISKLAPVRKFMLILVSVLSAITCTFGNWTAYGQTNIKRLLAYSTIAHAGYMMMPVAAALAAIGVDDVAARDAIGWLGFYIGTYLFMNLGAFAIVAFLRNAMRSEEIADYAGLFRQAPVIVICFSLILVSLIGIPPLAGFMAKFAIFGSLVATEQYPLLVVGGLNTVLSLFYYLRVIWVMAIEPEPENRMPFSLPVTSLEGVFVVLITIPVVTLGLWGNWLFVWTREAAAQLLS